MMLFTFRVLADRLGTSLVISTAGHGKRITHLLL
jgi:hypothetical protein